MYRIKVEYKYHILKHPKVYVVSGSGIRYFAILSVDVFENVIGSNVLPKVSLTGDIKDSVFNSVSLTPDFLNKNDVILYVKDKYIPVVKKYINKLREEYAEKIKLPDDEIVDI